MEPGLPGQSIAQTNGKGCIGLPPSLPPDVFALVGLRLSESMLVRR